jgi:hypothetical protein
VIPRVRVALAVAADGARRSWSGMRAAQGRRRPAACSGTWKARNLRSRPVIRMILTSDRLGEASRTYSPFAPRNRPYAPARLGPEVLCPGVISQAALIEGGSPRSWHSGRKHPRRCPPPPLRPPLFQLPRDTDNSLARSGTARSGRRRRARRTRTGDGQRRPACLQLPCPARPGQDLGSRRPLDEALSSLPAVPS